MHSSPRIWAVLSLLLPLAASSACAPDDQAGGDYFDPSASKQDNASGSRWRMPAEIARVGDTQEVDYTGAGAWTGDNCQGGMTEGAEALRTFLIEKYPQINSIGGYACRPIVGNPSQASVHSTGRALDIMLPVGFQAEAINGEGDPIGNFLVANAEEIGIQFVIWDRTSWGAHRASGAKERYYSGAHPHNDHLHVELSEEAGRGETAWLQDGWTPIEPSGTTEPPPPPAPPEEPAPIDELPEEPGEDPPVDQAPSVPPVGDQQPEEPEPTGVCATIPAEGGVIDSEECIWLRGPANYWQHENTGHDGALAWTRAVQSGKHQSSAEWEIKPEQDGNYEVQVFVEPEFATHRNARYYLSHGRTTDSFEADLTSGVSAANPWLSLGTFAFSAGGGQKLILFDNSDVAVNGEARVVVDAIRLIPEGAEAPDEPGNEDPDSGADDESPDAPSDPPTPGTPDEPTEDGPTGLVTNGCQSAPGHAPWASALFLLLALVAVRRRSAL